MSLQGPVINWVVDHRKHHTFTDEEGDPHSPDAGQGAGMRGMVAGLWHAHVGWLFSTHGQASSKRFARDLVEDPTMRRINKSFPLIALSSLLVPFLLGVALSGGSLVTGGLSALLWAGLVRIFLVHHITWSINSICHFFGRRRFDTDDQSTNVFWLALPSLGEAWHHNHHAFPQSAFHGLRWYELDPSGWLIFALKRAGLAWDVVRVTPEKATAKLAGDLSRRLLLRPCVRLQVNLHIARWRAPADLLQQCTQGIRLEMGCAAVAIWPRCPSGTRRTHDVAEVRVARCGPR
jgi:stearoyl-CoA desaturase (delta-9 desaturase)